jgi:hypothetical protein
MRQGALENVVPIIRHCASTLKHKAFVFRAGLRTRAPLVRLLLHDMSKFGPAEVHHYARQFFGAADIGSHGFA